MTTGEELKRYFELIDEDKRAFAFDTIDEYIYFKNKLKELQELPFIQISSKNPAKQRTTPAGKLAKEYSQIIDAKRGTLLRIINSVENSAADDLLAKLKEFE